MDRETLINSMADDLMIEYSYEDTMTILVMGTAIINVLVEKRMPLSSHLAVEALRRVATIIEVGLDQEK